MKQDLAPVSAMTRLMSPLDGQSEMLDSEGTYSKVTWQSKCNLHRWNRLTIRAESYRCEYPEMVAAIADVLSTK